MMTENLSAYVHYNVSKFVCVCISIRKSFKNWNISSLSSAMKIAINGWKGGKRRKKGGGGGAKKNSENSYNSH